MRVFIGASVFEGTVDPPWVLRLLHFAYERRHRLLVQPRVAYDRWAAACLTASLVERYAQGLDWSEELETRDPARYELRVEAKALDGAMDVQHAVERLERPFVLVVENDRSDRRFLEAVAPDECRARLRLLLERSWLLCRSRGGVSEIPKLIEDTLRDAPGETDRLYAMFDSDSEEPGKPRPENRRQGEACAKLGVRHHILTRRTIENYLTRPALIVWMKSSDRAQLDRDSSRVDALYGDWCAERPERRHHFHMKGGLGKMTRGSQYEGIPLGVERALREGFGDLVTNALDPETLRENDLRDEGSWDELSALVRDILRCAQ